MRAPEDHEQRDRAARAFDRNVVVVAGAGTGKTSLLVERVLHQVLERGTPLERLAAITFTEKAAAEMRERIEDGLEAALELLAGGARGEGTGDEADRVLARLEGEGAVRRELLLRRAREAIDALDVAPIDTIHGFASEILRRHPRESGVDPAFRPDADGREARALFEELWNELLLEVFGPGGSGAAAAAWRPLLERLSIDEIEEVARRLAGFPFREVLDERDERAAQRAHLRELGVRCLEGLEEVAAVVRRDRRCNRRLPPCLDSLRAIFTEIAERPETAHGGALAALVGPLPGSVGVGKHAGEELRARERDITRLLKTARRLPEFDLELPARLREVLGPFVERFHGEYLAGGALSFDGMIVLARDLLRDDARARREEAARLDVLLVDEFQDNDPLQYEIAFFLAASGRGRDAYGLPLVPGKLFIVGDPKQSIYRFRGADIGLYRRAVEAIERAGGEVLELTANFRSVPEVLEPLELLFRELFAGGGRLDPEFRSIAACREPAGEPRVEIRSVGVPDARALERREAEAAAAAQWIAEARESGVRYRDVAILLRAMSEVDVYLRRLRKWGIPYVVAGGRGFYERHEVAVLLAFLRAVVNPADPVALVSWLRSPAAGVPDPELQEHADAGGRWSLFAEADRERAPRLAAALDLAREFRRRHRGEPLDVLARAALDETPLRLAMAASYEGAQRAANLEKAVRRTAELAADGALSAEEVLDHIEEVESRQRNEGDSPLADETVDAVRVMTIHAAKGLEWPVVILADLARGVEQARRPSLETAASSGSARRLPPAIALRAGDVAAPAHELWRLEREEHERAETRRLLYVAATRARERLVLIAGAPRGTGRGTWIAPLAAWGYEFAGGFPAHFAFATGRVLHRRVESVPEPARADGDDEIDESLLAAVTRHAEAREAVAPAAAEWLRAPSGDRERAELAEPGESEIALDRPQAPAETDTRPATDAHSDAGADADADSDAATDSDAESAAAAAIPPAAGSAVHLLLEAWDRRDPAWLLEHAGRAARVAAAREGLDAAAVAEIERRVRSILERARRDGVLAELAKLPVVARELPILYRDERGDVWQGAIDCVAGTLERPEVIDYKTTATLSAAELARVHAAQLACYREALRRALDLAERPPARIVPLRAPPEASGRGGSGS